MRGEETQLLGVTELDFTGLVCIPGTHTKWIKIEAGEIIEFSTYMSGELFSAISQHTSSPMRWSWLVGSARTAGTSRKVLRGHWLRRRG
jgi:hypothetical protein